MQFATQFMSIAFKLLLGFVPTAKHKLWDILFKKRILTLSYSKH